MREDAVGPGHGFVDVFDTEGNLLRRLASGGSLNSPWGLAVAPVGFGAFGNDLLVGNNGDGRINVFDPNTGAFLGQLQDSTGQVITIANLWGLTFAGKGTSGDPGTLFFTAGIGGEQHGLFGSLQVLDSNGTGSVPGGSLGGTGRQGRPEGHLTDDAGNTYPLPPPGGPMFRESVAGVTPPLPVLLPFKELALPATPVTSSDSNGPSLTVSAADFVGRTGQEVSATLGIRTISWSFGTLLTTPESGPAEVIQASPPQALVRLLELSVLMDPTEGRAADRQILPPVGNGTGLSGTVPSTKQQTPPPATTEKTDGPAAKVAYPGGVQSGTRVPERALPITARTSSFPRGDEPLTMGRRVVNSGSPCWRSASTCLGSAGTSLEGPGEEDRRPQSFRP